MSGNTSIEWTDATWNPVTGCTEVSPGCDHCYAKTFAERWRGTPGHYFEHGFDVQLRPDKLDQPLRWRKPRKIFVNSMADLFHDDVPDDYIAKVFAVMALASQHTFQVLTKRHGRMRSLLCDGEFQQLVYDAWGTLDTPKGQPTMEDWPWPGWPLPNVWLGVSTENQQWADIRIPALLDTPADVRFISAEPLLGPINLEFEAYYEPDHTNCSGLVSPAHEPACGREPGKHWAIDWVIVGGESGPGARPMHPDWARSLRDQCQAAGVPFLFKQAGSVLAREWGCKGKGTDPAEWPEPFPREYPNAG
ncbi:hypothetical protein SEA_KARHDO_62 [Mycobacterium phage Karhdo]|nr:hypothetical protein SEA_KARHDO_62 [Mycobacterium phage Karhdo]